MELVFKHTFDIKNYGGKLFTVSAGDAESKFVISDLDSESLPGKEMQRLMKPVWDKEMEAFKNGEEKRYKEILAETEKGIYSLAKKEVDRHMLKEGLSKKETEKKVDVFIQEEGKGANHMIQRAVEGFQIVAEKKMRELWLKAAEIVDKKLKTNLRAAKIKAGFTMAGLAVAVVVTAAVGIAAAVAGLITAPTGVGLVAGFAVAAGALATTISAAKRLHDVYVKNWPNHKTAFALLKKRSDALDEALKYEEKKATKIAPLDKGGQAKSLGPKEKAKLLFLGTAGKRKELIESIDSMSAWVAAMERTVQAERLRQRRLRFTSRNLKKP